MKLFPISRYKVIGHSMLPNLKEGQEVLSFNWAYLFSKPKVGDVVVVKVNGKEMVKRITKFLDREKMIFVMGDNKKDSLDSRKLGWIDKKNLIGKVISYQ
ncbi:MAG: S26 family signal peptidase [Candidatus Daviesbacteria bacterium]|nr:S26 family signal peptidase [Candidatus Daviesbacteria bacterium]